MSSSAAGALTRRLQALQGEYAQVAYGTAPSTPTSFEANLQRNTSLPTTITGVPSPSPVNENDSLPFKDWPSESRDQFVINMLNQHQFVPITDTSLDGRVISAVAMTSSTVEKTNGEWQQFLGKRKERDTDIFSCEKRLKLAGEKGSNEHGIWYKEIAAQPQAQSFLIWEETNSPPNLVPIASNNNPDWKDYSIPNQTALQEPCNSLQLYTMKQLHKTFESHYSGSFYPDFSHLDLSTLSFNFFEQFLKQAPTEFVESLKFVKVGKISLINLELLLRCWNVKCINLQASSMQTLGASEDYHALSSILSSPSLNSLIFDGENHKKELAVYLYDFLKLPQYLPNLINLGLEYCSNVNIFQIQGIEKIQNFSIINSNLNTSSYPAGYSREKALKNLILENCEGLNTVILRQFLPQQFFEAFNTCDLSVQIINCQSSSTNGFEDLENCPHFFITPSHHNGANEENTAMDIGIGTEDYGLSGYVHRRDPRF